MAGHKGLVGSALVRFIESSTSHSWVGASRAELNLFDAKAVNEYVQIQQPDAIVIAAAKVGGISANSRFPVEFLSENLKIQLNLLEASHLAGVPRVLFLGSSCIYPKFAHVPISEDALLTGALEPTNDAYALAKIAGIRLVRAYSEEYGHDWISAMPANIYGPNDNFSLFGSHVVPALIRKFHEGKLSKSEVVSVWGDGSAMREFLHADDLANACIFLLENYHQPSHINVGTGRDVSILELATLIRDIVEYKGEIHWDTSKPNGTPRKVLDTSALNSLGWSPSIDLRMGIESTYKSFVNSYSGDFRGKREGLA